MEVTNQLSEKALRDYQLVCSARDNGDQKAFADLMSIYRDPLYFMLLKMTNDATDAEDLTIEALGKAFKNLHQYSPNYAFSTWLFRIASNNCIDYIRKKRMKLVSMHKLTVGGDSQETSFDLTSDLPTPEEKVIEAQKIKMMRQVVNKLKPHYKTLIEMRYFKEYSYEEISQELDLPLGTIKVQLFRARDLLFQIMKNVNETI